MACKNIFIKISGDFSPLTNKKIIDFIREKSVRNHVVVLPGAGLQISEALKEKGIEYEFSEAGKRVIKSHCGRMLAFQIAEKIQTEVREVLIGERINAYVELPFRQLGSVLTPVDGDDFAKLAYASYDEVYVITVAARIKKKEAEFRDYPKVIIKDY